MTCSHCGMQNTSPHGWFECAYILRSSRDHWIKRAKDTEQKLTKAATALREIFEGPPQVWLDWYNRHEAIISELDPDIYCQDFGHPPEKIDVDGKCTKCGEKESS